MKTENIVQFLRTNCDPQQLADLLAHTEMGRLHYASCCCLIGSVTSPHALIGHVEFCKDSHHLTVARSLPFAEAAEKEFFQLTLQPGWREILADLIRAEMSREREAEEMLVRR